MPTRDAHAELAAVASTRWKIAVALTVLMLLTYFGFILLAAFARAAMGSQIVPGLSVGITLGAVVIVASWLFTGLYVRWANGRYDSAVRAAREAGAR